MLPAADLSEIISNLSALNLQSDTIAQVLAAVLAPLMRSPELGHTRSERVATCDSFQKKRPPRGGAAARPRAASPRKRKKAAGRAAPNMIGRARARAALQANPDATLTDVANAVGCSRATVANARADLAAQARKQARKPPEKEVMAKQSERRERAQQWLRQHLADGPQRVSDIEAAAEKAHVDQIALERARADLGIVPSRANAGNTLSVQWSLPTMTHRLRERHPKHALADPMIATLQFIKS